jgi:hypothetical protein
MIETFRSRISHDLFTGGFERESRIWAEPESKESSEPAGLYRQMVEAQLVQFKLQQRLQRRMELIIMLQAIGLFGLMFMIMR